MNAIRALWESLLQESLGVIGLGDDHARRVDKLIKPDCKIARREDVVRVCSQTKSDPKKFMNPKSRTCRHARKVCMNMINSNFPKAETNVNSLIKPQKIRAPTPLIDCSDNFGSKFSAFRSAANVIQ